MQTPPDIKLAPRNPPGDAPSVFQQLELLSRTPEVLRALLADTAAEWHEGDEGEGTWSPRQVLGHLIYVDEEVWMVRAATLREHGEARAFAPGDASIHLARYAQTPLDELLERFAAVREASLSTVRRWPLDEAALARRGRHTVYGTVTLGNLIAAWVAHDLTHLTQVARVLAKQLTGVVGNLRESLSILDPRPRG